MAVTVAVTATTVSMRRVVVTAAFISHDRVDEMGATDGPFMDGQSDATSVIHTDGSKITSLDI